MADSYVLSEATFKSLQDTVESLRRAIQNPQGRPAVIPEDQPAPEVYVALTPSGGIPARVGTALGNASCNIYKIISGSLLYADFTRTVYNLSTTAVGGAIYIQVKRDKFGVWLAEQVIGSGGGCSSVTVSEEDTRCEDGNLNRYTRAITLTTNSAGCLVKGTGAWILDRVIACCDPSCLPGGVYTGTGTGTGTQPGGDFECGPCGPCNPFPCEPCVVFGSGMANGECSDCVTDLPDFVRLYEVVANITTCQWQGSFTLCGSTWRITFGYAGYIGGSGGYKFHLEICDTVSIDCVQYEGTILGEYPVDCLTMTLNKTGQANTGTPKCTWPSSLAVHPCSSPGTGTGGGGGGGGGGGALSIAGVGTGSSSGVSVASLTIPNVTVQAGILVVNVMVFQGGTLATPTVTFNGTPLSDTNGGLLFPSSNGRCHQLRLEGVAASTGDVVITPDTNAIIEAQCINIVGGTAMDVSTKNRGSSTTPDVGPSGSTTVADTAVCAVFFMYDTSSIGGVWAGTPTFIDGGQDVNDTKDLTFIKLTEGRYISSAIQTIDAELTGVTPFEWVGITVVYR